MSNCSKCGKQLAAGDRFCVGCGAPVTGQPGAPKLPERRGQGDSVQASFGSIKKSNTTAKSAIIIALIILFAGGGLWCWKTYGSTGVRTQNQLDLAVKYVSDNDFEKAILAYNEAISIDSKDPRPYQGLARIYTLQGKYDDAQDAYDKGLNAVSNDNKQTLQLGLAGMYIDQNKLSEAEKTFEGIKTSNPNCLEAYWGIAMINQKKGDNGKAEAILYQAVEKNPNEYRGYNILALFLQQNGKSKEAFDNLITSLELEINQQEAYPVLTDVYQEKWPELLAQAANLSNQQVASMLKFFSFYSAGDNEKAIQIYQEELARQNSNQKVHILAATAMLKVGDKADAEQLIKPISEKNLSSWLLGDLAWYYQTSGDNARAREYAIKALESDGTNLDVIALLQTLNTDEASGKIYAAQALLYNWKPIDAVKQEMQTKGITMEILKDFMPAKSELTEKGQEAVLPEVNTKEVPTVEAKEPANQGNVKMAGNKGRPFSQPKRVASPTDSGTVAYTTATKNALNLYIQRNNQSEQITSYESVSEYSFNGVGDFDWSPDGTKIAFSYCQNYGGVSSNPSWFSGLAVYDLGTKSTKVLIKPNSGKGAFGPRWVQKNGSLMIEYETIVMGEEVFTEPGEVGHWYEEDGKTYCFGQEYWIERRLIKY